MELRNSIERRLLGKSQAIEEIKEQIQKIAPTDLPVLITGETGVGKTLAAELIHELSPRASREFIHLNCSNISPSFLNRSYLGMRGVHLLGLWRGRRGN